MISLKKRWKIPTEQCRQDATSVAVPATGPVTALLIHPLTRTLALTLTPILLPQISPPPPPRSHPMLGLRRVILEPNQRSRRNSLKLGPSSHRSSSSLTMALAMSYGTSPVTSSIVGAAMRYSFLFHYVFFVFLLLITI